MYKAGRTRKWNLIQLLVIIMMMFTFSAAHPVRADGGGGGASPVAPQAITYDQNVNAQLPLDVTLTDENGKTVQLSQYFNEKPVILIFAYYHCTMLCGLALSDFAHNLKNVKSSAGTDFQVLTVSFDTKDTYQLAAAKKADYMVIYNRPEAAEGWHFFVGKQDSIDRLTETAGFHYQYDPITQQYAHPTGVIVLSPAGKIMRYIFGIDYNANDLRLALLDATNKKTASPLDQVFLLCYHYDPVTGKYTVAINNIIRIAGTVTVLVLAGFILLLSSRSKKGGLPGERKNARTTAQADRQSVHGQ